MKSGNTQFVWAPLAHSGLASFLFCKRFTWRLLWDHRRTTLCAPRHFPCALYLRF